MFSILKLKRSCSITLCIIFLITLFIGLFFFKNHATNDGKTNKKSKSSKDALQNEISKRFNSCPECLALAFKNITENDFDQKWADLHSIVGDCCEENFKNMSAEIMYNKDEAKYIIHPINPFTTNECHVITLGIGNDTLVEEKMFKKNPFCTFLGVDPHLNNGGFEYMQFGKFVEAAVGNKNGTFEASILSNNTYITKKIKHISFKHILKTSFYFDIIDYLFMDVEGAEFEIFNDFVDYYRSYPKICQLNIEFHSTDKESKIKRNIFNTFYKSVIKKLFLPLHVDLATPFNRIFLFNINDEICLKKYLNIKV